MVLEIEPTYQFPFLIKEPRQFLPLEPDNKKGGKQWADVKAVWQKQGTVDSPSEKAANLWKDIGLSLMGWDPAKVDEKTGSEFTGALPRRLVDDITDYYLWAPNLSHV